MAALWIILGLIVIVAIGFIVSYNRFVSQRQLIKDAWANIDTELRRRYDLIPNLVETVKGYASHEREIFEEVARTRSLASGATGTPAAQAAAEGFDGSLAAGQRRSSYPGMSPCRRAS